MTGRDIAQREITPDRMRQDLRGAGLPPDYAEFLLRILGFLAQGCNAGVTDQVEQLIGCRPRDFNRYAREHLAAWQPRAQA